MWNQIDFKLLIKGQKMSPYAWDALVGIDGRLVTYTGTL